MKLVTPREPFLHLLQFAASVCPTRSPRPILSDIRVEAENGQVRMAATDGDISVRLHLEDDGITGDGVAALPAATLLSAIRSMASETISLSESDSSFELTGERAYFKLNGDDPELFPSIPTIEGGQGVEVPLGAFVSLCQRTTFAAAKEMGRYAFNGVLLELGTDEITLVATDGRRLALARMACATGLTEARSAVVPIKGLNQLQRLAGDDDEAVLRIDLRESMVAFVLPKGEIQAQLVQGEFPDFRAVVPAEEAVANVLSVSRDDLATAIQRALVTAGDDGPKVDLAIAEGLLTVVSSKEGLGESRSEIEVEYSGEPVQIRFNPLFIGEYLKHVGTERLSFCFKDRSSAGLFRADEFALYVVMPITS